MNTSGAWSWFFIAAACAVAAAVFLGFAPSFYLRAPERGPLSPLFIAHGLVFTAWFALFIAQAVLARRGAFTLHKTLGFASAPLALAMVLLGFEAGRDAFLRGVGLSEGGPPEVFFFLSWSDALGFTLLYGAALLMRRRGDWHKRLMLLASISMLLPATGRLSVTLGVDPLSAVAMQFAFLAPLLAFDLRTLRRAHPATLAGAALLVLKIVGVFTLAETEAWFAYARWLTAEGFF